MCHLTPFPDLRPLLSIFSWTAAFYLSEHPAEIIRIPHARRISNLIHRHIRKTEQLLGPGDPSGYQIIIDRRPIGFLKDPGHIKLVDKKIAPPDHPAQFFPYNAHPDNFLPPAAPPVSCSPSYSPDARTAP